MLWLEGAANGKADSGKWVFPDSRFTLQNRTSGEVLAQHDVGKACVPNDVNEVSAMAHAAAYTTADATAACSAVAVVIPCYKVATHILPLLARIGPEVLSIIVVDDACPEGSGDVKARCTDPRVEVVFHPRNLGVGRGYHRISTCDCTRRGGHRQARW